MTWTLWWMLGVDALALAVLGLLLVEAFVPRSFTPPRRVAPAVASDPWSAHCRAPGRRTVARTLRRRVPRTGGGAHAPGRAAGTEAQRRLCLTMEFEMPELVPGA